MKPLLTSELLRFRSAALTGAAAHAVILGILGTFSDLFTASEEKLGIGLVCYALLGLFLGVYQVGSFRRLGSFSYLIHRPLAPARILLALTGAAVLLLTFVAGLPLLLAAILVPTDTRNLLVAPLVLGICLCFHLIGVFLVLNPSRARFAVLLVPAAFLFPELSPGATFLALGGTLLWLWILASAAFKPDLSTHLDRPLPIAALALPVQAALLPALSLSLLFVYSFGVAISEVGWRNVPAFGWNDYFPEDTFQRVEYLDAAGALSSGLRRAGLPEAFDAESAFELSPRRLAPQRRGQLLIHDRHQTFTDDAHGLLFTFSHDLMLFTGRVTRTGQPAGWLGPAGRAEGTLPSIRFEDVPEVVDGRFFVSARQIHGRAQLFEAPAGETIVGVLFPETGTEPTAILTDHALHLVAPRRVAIPFEGDARNLSRAIAARDNDETLVSFVLGKESERDGALARQTLGRVDCEGRYRQLANLPLRQGPPAWTRHRNLLVAPLLTFASEAALRKPLSRPPVSLWVVTILIALISSALTFLVAHRRGLPSSWAWSAAALLTGLPGFLTFLLLTPRTQT